MALTTNKQNDNKTSNSSQVVYFKKYFGSPLPEDTNKKYSVIYLIQYNAMCLNLN